MTHPARIRRAYDVICRSANSPVLVYAPAASIARAEVIRDLRAAWGCSFAEALREVVRVSRRADRDVVLPPRHPLAGMLPPKILHNVVHAFGGRGIRAGYRDHFYASSRDWTMRAALYHGLFEVARRDTCGSCGSMLLYVLTDLGRDVARGEQPTYPGAGQ